MSCLEILADLASVLTAIFAAAAVAYVSYDARSKRIKLERYLKAESAGSLPQHTVLHLMAKVGLTEAEVFQASFRSKHIRRLLAESATTGHASAILLEYKP